MSYESYALVHANETKRLGECLCSAGHNVVTVRDDTDIDIDTGWATRTLTKQAVCTECGTRLLESKSTEGYRLR